MKQASFIKAVPIWAEGRENEKNCEFAYRFNIPSGDVCLNIAATSIYRVLVNGEFVASGPARAGAGFYCIDRISLRDSLEMESNVVVIEVVAYNRAQFDYMKYPGFVCAEFVADGEVIAYTSTDTSTYDLKKRVRRTQPYSARGFAECYIIKSEQYAFYTDMLYEAETEKTQLRSGMTFIERRVPYPEYEKVLPEKTICKGTVGFDRVYEPRTTEGWTEADETLTAFDYDTLTERLAEDSLHMDFTYNEKDEPVSFPYALSDSYVTFKLPIDTTGFAEFTVDVPESCDLYFFFDELYIYHNEYHHIDVNTVRVNSPSDFKYTLDKGVHVIRTFAPYTMQYVKFIARGKLSLNSFRMIEFKHPPVKYSVNTPEGDTELKKIADAAVETFKTNAVDVYTDCPSRERAGWLCDSFFTARVEKVLTGGSEIEKSFFENFLMVDKYEYLPEGMLPMCYPSDHTDGLYIPNWAMWFVIEFKEYFDRSGDKELVSAAKKKIMDLMEFLARYENSDGLLEKLDGWVFLEWSRANDKDVIQDINFPTNMLYMMTLEKAAELYDVPLFREKAEKLKKVIRERSYNGKFFTDNELYTDGVLKNPGNTTEVCQYYAFFTETATPETYPELWETLLKDFGPERKDNNAYPDVAFANAFIGNYLRLELIYRAGEKDKLVENIRGYFLGMAESTGTLWEDMNPTASCDHGFASHVLYWLAGLYGIKEN